MLCLRLTAVQNNDQPIDIPGPDLVDGRLALARGRDARTQLLLLSSSAAQHMSPVSMFVVIGGAPVLITETIVRGGHDSAPPLHRIYFKQARLPSACDIK